MDLSTLSNDYNHLTLKGKFVLPKKWKVFPKEKWAHIVTHESSPVLHEAFINACQKLKIENPLFFVLYKDESINGFYASGNTVFLSTGAIEQLTDPDVLAIIAHELGHYRRSRRDFLKQSLVVAASFLACKGLDEIDWSKVDPFGHPQYTKLASTALTAYLGTQLMYFDKRQEEYHADAAAAEAAGMEATIEMLGKLPDTPERTQQKWQKEKRFVAEQPFSSKRVLAQAIIAAMDTFDLLRDALRLQDHPSNAKRINALKAQDSPER